MVDSHSVVENLFFLSLIFTFDCFSISAIEYYKSLQVQAVFMHTFHHLNWLALVQRNINTKKEGAVCWKKQYNKVAWVLLQQHSVLALRNQNKKQSCKKFQIFLKKMWNSKYTQILFKYRLPIYQINANFHASSTIWSALHYKVIYGRNGVLKFSGFSSNAPS